MREPPEASGQDSPLAWNQEPIIALPAINSNNHVVAIVAGR
jgi:hypothetical protein